MEQKLLEIAKNLVGEFKLNGFRDNLAGTVATALITKDGNIYTGICVVVACGMGFCAEHAAIAEMLKNRETEIDMIATVGEQYRVYPPCGRCREFMLQVNKNNLNTNIVVDENKIVTLKELLPYNWSI